MRVLASIFAGMVVLAGCSGDEEAASPSPTPVESPSPEPSPSPSPSPTGPFAPFTGEVVAQADAERPALVVKIENTAKARPQAGLELADIVVEELVEGGITRFFAVFQSRVPEQVGPIRSARLVDAELLPAFDGILLYSGGRPEVESAVRSASRVLLTEGDPGVSRDASRRRPSNLFAQGEGVYAEALRRDPELTAPEWGWIFDVAAPAGACTTCDGASIDISMSTQNTSGWSYDASAGVYRRDSNGTPQPTVSGDDVGAANVIALAVELTEGGCCDSAGSPYIDTRTTGGGRAIILRDGAWYEGEWARASASDPWTFLVDGVPFPMKHGPTWIHLVPGQRLPAAP